ESVIPLNEIVSQIPSSIEIILVLPTFEEPEDSLIMGDEDLNTIPKKETDEVIKSSVEDLVPIPSESEDTSGSDSDDVNPLSDELLENIESKNSYDSNLDKPTLLVIPLFDANKDECFYPGGDVDEIGLLLYHDLSTFNMSVVSILEGFTDEPPLEENDDLFEGDIDEIDAFLEIDVSTDIKDGYHGSKGDVLYLESLLCDDTILNPPLEVFLDRDLRSLSDINDVKIMVKVFDPEIHEKKFSPTYVRLPFKDRHYIFFTYVI
nr:hypothetical protein [Tanacetum cinerariifolium]